MDDTSTPKMPWRSAGRVPEPWSAVLRKLDRICTKRLLKVIRLANREAAELRHEYLGTEHLLIGLLKEGTGIAVKVLKEHGVSIHDVRKEVARLVLPGPEPPWGPQYRVPFTPRASAGLIFAQKESRKLKQKHRLIGTEHLLLALLWEQKCVAAQVLMNLGVHLGELDADLRKALRGNPQENRTGLTQAAGQRRLA